MQIANTIEESGKRVGDLTGSNWSNNWEIAANVYAFTQEGKAGGINQYNKSDRVSVRDHPVSFRAYAALNILGLRSDKTVAKYHRQWAWAVEIGQAEDVKPGDEFEEPDIEWDDPEGYFPRPPEVEEGQEEEDEEETEPWTCECGAEFEDGTERIHCDQCNKNHWVDGEGFSEDEPCSECFRNKRAVDGPLDKLSKDIKALVITFKRNVTIGAFKDKDGKPIQAFQEAFLEHITEVSTDLENLESEVKNGQYWSTPKQRRGNLRAV